MNRVEARMNRVEARMNRAVKIRENSGIREEMEEA